MARAEQPQQVVALPLGGREHALGTAAVEEAAVGQVLAAEAGARDLQPEIPILEAGPHGGGVEAQAALEDLPPHQAAGLAVILHDELQQRVVAAAGAILRRTEFVDIRVEPADPGRRRAQRRPGPRQEGRAQPVVGIEEEQRPRIREGGQGEFDPGVPRRRKPLVALPQQADPAGMGGGVLQRDRRGRGRGAAVIHHHRGDGRRA